MNGYPMGPLRLNIFSAAWKGIEDWEFFPWHRDSEGRIDTHQYHSSQALAIDMFGTLKTRSVRHEVLNVLAERAGCQHSDNWTISLAWMDMDDVLKEGNQRTRVDAVAMSDETVIFFDGVFTEPGGAACSQAAMIRSGVNKGRHQCNGNYELQLNPVNGKCERCALTARGMRYWQVIPQVFDLKNDCDHTPCPFKGYWFEWMCSLTMCHTVAEHSGRKAAFYLVYADAETFPMAQQVHSKEWEQFTGLVKNEVLSFSSISYQELASLAFEKETDVKITWQSLQDWIREKIEHAVIGQTI